MHSASVDRIPTGNYNLTVKEFYDIRNKNSSESYHGVACQDKIVAFQATFDDIKTQGIKR